MSDQKLCRWGILGTAGIARKNWHAIQNSGNGQLVAVASRSQDRAQEYIDENQAEVAHDPAPRAIGGYEEMIAAEDLDALYIPLPTGVRKEFVLLAAQAGKHVLCEKPCGKTPADVEEIVAACREAGVQFMDGVMFMHSDRLPAIRGVLEDCESIGTIRRIASQFSFGAPDDFLQENIRMHSDLEPLGSLGDLGWYNIRFTLWALNYEMPKAVTGRLITTAGRPDSPDSVPIQFSGEMLFESGPTASFYTSFETEHQQWAHVSGTKGNLRVDDFVLPYFDAEVGFTVSNAHFDINGTDFRMERHERRVVVNEYANNHPTAQETKLFRNFADLVLSGKTDDHWPEIALKTQQVMNACLDSARNGGAEVTL
ncbi:MAG: Gfo/Idh/MocA family oxidoreductase [Verrucomicrobiales bacterium]|nr:Gfo/Idh/MocA family oxidoreductase [Verrucomicrobiales bacterium]